MRVILGISPVECQNYSIHWNYGVYRFIQYNPTSLERSHKHELLTEVDLGVPIDLILPDTYPIHDPDG